MEQKRFNVAFTSTMYTKVWNPIPITWQAFLERIQQVEVTEETMAEYDALDKADQRRSDLKNAGGAFFCGQLRKPRRLKENFVNRSMLKLDADFADMDFVDNVHQTLKDEAYVLYESRSSRPGKLKYRLIVPLDKPVSDIAHEAISRKIADHIGIDYFDPASFQDVRAMYAASASKDQDIQFIINDGEYLDCDNVLSEYKEWYASNSWALTVDERKNGAKFSHKKGGSKSSGKRDPRSINGIVGEFCLLFTIDEAIDHYLQHAYETAGDGKYTFVGGTSHGGLYILDDEVTVAYSHHSSDPANDGYSKNAFDLVKVHLFDDMDDDIDTDNTPLWKKTSTATMRYFLKKNPEFQKRREKIDEVRAEFEKERLKE